SSPEGPGSSPGRQESSEATQSVAPDPDPGPTNRSPQPQEDTETPDRRPGSSKAESRDLPTEGTSSPEGPGSGPGRQAAADSQANTPSDPAPPIEARIQHLLDNYSLQFAVGNLDGLLSLLAAEPRENRNRGRAWFRDNYGRLFDESAARRIDIEVLDVNRRAQDWRVAARFDLRVNYPDREPATAERRVEYSIVEDAEGRLRIRAIDY
ncbi:hypothetical protein DZC52_01575, partial [Wenzhouxiangella sediminis]